MKIVHQTDRALEVFVSGRPRLLLGAAAFALGLVLAFLGWREAQVLLLSAGVFCGTIGAGSIWMARDIHHALDADRGTVAITARRLLGGGERRTVTTIHELARIADVELEERRGTARARRRGRRHPTYRLVYRFDDGGIEPWSDVHRSNRRNHEECQAAARAVLHAWRTLHSRSA